MEAENVDSDSGVTAPEGVTEDAPQPAGESPTPESGEIGKEAISKSENRYQKLANEAKRYKTDYQKAQEQLEAHRGAIDLHKALSGDPKKARLMMELMDESRASEILSKVFGEVEDPYKDFAPEVADRFRKLDALEKWKEDQERISKDRQAKDQENSFTSNLQSLESEFESLLSSSGYMKDGKPVNEGQAKVIANATRTALLDIAQNPNYPTKQELKEAYSSVISDLSQFQKSVLKNAVKPNGVPVSGSSAGKLPASKVDYTKQENRISRLLAG